MMEKIDKKISLLHKITIDNLLGIHARPAAKIAEIANQAKLKVWLSANNNKVDAQSMIDILTLGACMGTEVVIEVETPEDIFVLNMICDLFKSRFGEE